MDALVQILLTTTINQNAMNGILASLLLLTNTIEMDKIHQFGIKPLRRPIAAPWQQSIYREVKRAEPPERQKNNQIPSPPPELNYSIFSYNTNSFSFFAGADFTYNIKYSVDLIDWDDSGIQIIPNQENEIIFNNPINGYYRVEITRPCFVSIVSDLESDLNDPDNLHWLVQAIGNTTLDRLWIRIDDATWEEFPLGGLDYSGRLTLPAYYLSNGQHKVEIGTDIIHGDEDNDDTSARDSVITTTDEPVYTVFYDARIENDFIFFFGTTVKHGNWRAYLIDDFDNIWADTGIQRIEDWAKNEIIGFSSDIASDPDYFNHKYFTVSLFVDDEDGPALSSIPNGKRFDWNFKPKFKGADRTSTTVRQVNILPPNQQSAGLEQPFIGMADNFHKQFNEMLFEENLWGLRFEEPWSDAIPNLMTTRTDYDDLRNAINWIGKLKDLTWLAMIGHGGWDHFGGTPRFEAGTPRVGQIIRNLDITLNGGVNFAIIEGCNMGKGHESFLCRVLNLDNDKPMTRKNFIDLKKQPRFGFAWSESVTLDDQSITYREQYLAKLIELLFKYDQVNQRFENTSMEARTQAGRWMEVYQQTDNFTRNPINLIGCTDCTINDTIP